MLSLRRYKPLLFLLTLLAGGCFRFSPCPAATISISASDPVYNGTQPNANGTAITLSGGDLYPDPSLSDLSPAVGQTAIVGGPFANFPSVPYATNLREARYSLSGGILSGTAESGAAYGKVSCNGVQAGDTVTVNSVVFTAVSGTPSTDQFQVNASDVITAANLRTAINASTDVGIVGDLQAVPDLDGDNVVWIEAVTPGASGNAYALASSNGTRLAVTGFAHGADNALAAAPFWYVARTISLGSPLAAGKKVRFRFTVGDTALDPLTGATSYATVFFSGAGESVHNLTFSLSSGQVTTAEVAPLNDTTVITVGVAVVNYRGSWQLSDFHLLESEPDAFDTAGELTIPVNLSRAAGPPSGPATGGIGGSIKRLGFLTGGANKASNLIGLQAGDVVVTGIGDPSSISQSERNIVTQALAQGLEIYGYVALGEDDDPLNVLPWSEAQLTTLFQRAKSLGIAGIYFDIPDLGPPWPGGFGVSRYRQIWATNACHNLGLKVLFNSVSTVLDNSVIAGNANTDEGVQHGISDGTPIPWIAGDGILAESWGLRSDHVSQNWNDFQATGLRMLNAKKDLGLKIYGLFYQLPTRNALTQADERAYAYYSSALYEVDAYSLLNTSTFSDDYARPDAAFIGNSFQDTVPTVDASGNRISRRTDVGQVEVTNDPSEPSTSDTARTGSVFATQQKITVTSMSAPETLNGGTVTWKIASSSDGSNFGSETTLTDSGGTLSGFPADLPSYVRLHAVLTTPNPAQSPTLAPPFSVSATYGGTSYAELHGTILPSASDENVLTATLTLQRLGNDPGLVGGVVYSPISQTKTIAVGLDGSWETFVAASAAGTRYKATLTLGTIRLTKILTLAAGSSSVFPPAPPSAGTGSCAVSGTLKVSGSPSRETLSVYQSDKTTIVTTITTDDNGDFLLYLDPGDYDFRRTVHGQTLDRDLTVPAAASAAFDDLEAWQR